MTQAPTDTPPITAADVLAGVQALTPAIAARAREVEAAGRVPADLLDDLRRAGAFRTLLPRSHGGAGADLASALRVVEALARADASVAWTVMIGGGAWVDLAGLPRTSFDALFAGPGDTVVAGVFAPSGTATPIDGGYLVAGRWAFASGCEHADVLFGNCHVVGDDGAPARHDGPPDLRIAVFRPDDVVIEDTWHASGLRGTGSHHIRVDGVVVPADRTAALLADEPCLDEPVVRVPVPSLMSMTVAAVALGNAQAALDDVVGLATAKTPLLAPEPLAANPLFQHSLATAETELRAARTLVYEAAAELWDAAATRAPASLPRTARARATGAWAVERATHVVDTAYRSAGGTAVYDESPLQRRLRDAHAITQHFVVKADTLTAAGAVLAGREPGVPVF